MKKDVQFNLADETPYFEHPGIKIVEAVDCYTKLTLEMKINYFLPVWDVKIYAEGRVIHKGKKFAVSDVDIKNVAGHLIAKAIVTCAISSNNAGPAPLNP
jgi:uncharacterized protein (TIGR00369 family)